MPVNCLLRLFHAVSIAALLLGLTLVSGCDSGPKKPTVHPVSGELFVKGMPAAGAKLILQPLDNADPANWPQGFPRAKVEADGKFHIELFEPKDGAPPGKYKLLAYWLSGEDGNEEDADAQPRVNQIDAKYNDPALSSWLVEVKPEPNTLPRFDVP